MLLGRRAVCKGGLIDGGGGALETTKGRFVLRYARGFFWW